MSARGPAPLPLVVDLSIDEERDLAVRISSAWKELRRGAAMVAVRDYFFVSESDSIEPGQMDALDLLVQKPAWRMSDLAEGLRVDPSTATRAVHRLVRAGLADRSSGAEDGRVVMVSATDDGRQRHAAIALRRRQSMARMLGEFAPEERQQLADLLDRFVAALDHLAADLPDG
jgi:DNA-binding MarR family transcriptional regulator